MRSGIRRKNESISSRRKALELPSAETPIVLPQHTLRVSKTHTRCACAGKRGQIGETHSLISIAGSFSSSFRRRSTRLLDSHRGIVAICRSDSVSRMPWFEAPSMVPSLLYLVFALIRILEPVAVRHRCIRVCYKGRSDLPPHTFCNRLQNEGARSKIDCVPLKWWRWECCSSDLTAYKVDLDGLEESTPKVVLYAITGYSCRCQIPFSTSCSPSTRTFASMRRL